MPTRSVRTAGAETSRFPNGAAGGNARLVLREVALVIGQPREVVARRIRAADVLSVTEVPEAGSVNSVGDT